MTEQPQQPPPTQRQSHPPRQVDVGLLELLVCPVSGGVLRYDAAARELVCETSGLAYPIRDGIPIMLPEEARTLQQG